MWQKVMIGFLVTLWMFTWQGGDHITPAKDLTAIQIKKLDRTAELGHMTFSEFTRVFDVQSIRKTHQGCYAILPSEDGKQVFCFFDERDILFQVMVYDGFASKSEFDKLLMERATLGEVLRFDPNWIETMTYGAVGIEATIHIVQEGICVVRYRDPDWSRTRSANKYIEYKTFHAVSMLFVENEQLTSEEWAKWFTVVPQILEIDKVDKYHPAN